MPHPLGFIHGRFQVVHNDHLRYLLAGKSLCDHLIIGVTNPTPELTADEATDPQRSNSANNPLTYEEREEMIRDALIEAGVDEAAFEIIPFPINRPELLADIAPREAIYYLTIYDEWGREKKKRFEALGLTTHVMWEKSTDEKGLTGTQVRAAIRNRLAYHDATPPSVAKKIEAWNLQERLGGTESSGS
ncbi:adenylyltransferase/cytidyltransferase family protein [Pseudodesulfovibrio sp. zrk46]|uniref:adenylyltransferase/cytidyltransferase family protein n=1 Tax=Pseudodesulfovibrio sp. zrk46 TaxID=2725288 RepID=UPI0014490F6F|nr:adenylyltransferase/cytidyltransferase family protein [Pseudodesulfovibrio sp. zrk46]QJB57310.1 adenylyltransferase/cytidyltransferase family protein [Pseudodesulfovibrio sp. zrk46]